MTEIKEFLGYRKYHSLDPVRRLHWNGRELLGKRCYITVKRDGECVCGYEDIGFYTEDNPDGVIYPEIGSRKQAVAASDIMNRMKGTPEYVKLCDLLKTEREDYGEVYVCYGELQKHVSPTRVEMPKKNLHWVMFDIWDVKNDRYLGYNKIFQLGKKYRIPVVKLLEIATCNTLEEITTMIDEHLVWAKRHKREGIVGKIYSGTPQIMFKEKIDLPKKIKIRSSTENRPLLPPMPEDKVIRAMQHAFDEVGEENWNDVSQAMPCFARHVATEAEEHYYQRPKNIYSIYMTTDIEKLKPKVVDE